MSSSDDRRRPRVAGHRRRARATDPAPASAPVTEPVTEPGAVTAVPVETDPEPTQTRQGAAVVEVSREPEVPQEPEVAQEPEASREPEDEDVAPADRGRRVARPLVAPLVALVAALALLGGVAAVSFGDPGARDRDARAATAAARADLEQLLSYDHQTLERQAQANAALLTGSFKEEYATTMRTTILPVATKEKAVVRARTYEAGVMDQTEDTVRVQVFLNQAKTSEGQEEPSVDQNRVIATMQRVDGRWLIARLEAY